MSRSWPSYVSVRVRVKGKVRVIKVRVRLRLRIRIGSGLDEAYVRIRISISVGVMVSCITSGSMEKVRLCMRMEVAILASKRAIRSPRQMRLPAWKTGKANGLGA